MTRRQAGDYDGNLLLVDEELWREQWQRQVSRARRYFGGRPDFFEVDLTAGGGWSQLCELLEVTEPAEPFPWANRDQAKDD
jgi:Sulfotransferase domain